MYPDEESSAHFQGWDIDHDNSLLMDDLADGMLHVDAHTSTAYMDDTSAQNPSCTYKNVVCSCTPGDHLLDKSLPATSTLHVDHTCKILAAIDSSFHRYFRYVICGCESFVPLGQLAAHFKKKHADQLRAGCTRTMRRDFLLVIEHIAASCCIPVNQDTSSFDAFLVTGPIAGIAKATKLLCCPDCGIYSVSRQVIGRHLRGAADCPKDPHKAGPYTFDDVVEEWTQWPFSFNRQGKRVAVFRPSTQVEPSSTVAPEVERYSIAEHADSYCPPWLQRLGWMDWRDDQIKAGLTLPNLLSFVALPPRNPVLKFSTPPTRDEIFNWVGKRIQSRLKKMLEDGNKWLNKINKDIRLALTAQYVLHTLHVIFQLIIFGPGLALFIAK
jgi:hypothetical protein